MKGSLTPFWIPVKGNSMYPLIVDQDSVLIVPILAEAISLGDILLFKNHDTNELTLHRLIDFPLITKGDYSLLTESNQPVNLLGKAIECNHHNNFFNLSALKKTFCYLSAKRNGEKSKIERSLALVGLMIFSSVLKFYNAKTTSSHT